MENDAGFWQLFADTFIGYSYTLIGYISSLLTLEGITTGLGLSSLGTVIFAIHAIYNVVSGKDGLENFLWLRDVARESRSSQRYRDVITRGLAWLGDSKRMSGPFSYRAFRVCLVLAVVYPMLFWLIAWVVGGSGDFAGPITLSSPGVEETSMWRRLFVLGVLIYLVVLYYYFFKNKDRFVAFLSFHLERMLHGKLPENMVRAVVAVGAVGAVLVVLTLVAGVAGVAGGMGGAGIVFVLVGAFGAFVAFGGVLLVAIIAIFVLSQGSPDVAVFLLTFYTLLPVVNAFFDWLSIGASRRLIRLLLDRHSVWLAALLVGVDLALALLFMGMISLFIPFLLGAINSGLSTLENPVAIHWQETIEAARTAPWTAGLMATAMIVTTLIPTAVHLFAALVSLAPVDLSQTKLAKTSDEAAEDLAPLGRAWTALQSFAIPIVFSWGILVLATITLLSLSQAAHQGGLGDLLIDWALAWGTFAEGLF